MKYLWLIAGALASLVSMLCTGSQVQDQVMCCLMLYVGDSCMIVALARHQQRRVWEVVTQEI